MQVRLGVRLNRNNFFSQKRHLPVVKHNQFWIVKESPVERSTCTLSKHSRTNFIFEELTWKCSYFFIVQSFAFILPDIRPGGNPNLGAKNSVTLSHSWSNNKFLKNVLKIQVLKGFFTFIYLITNHFTCFWWKKYVQKKYFTFKKAKEVFSSKTDKCVKSHKQIFWRFQSNAVFG